MARWRKISRHKVVISYYVLLVFYRHFERVDLNLAAAVNVAIDSRMWVREGQNDAFRTLD